MAQEVTTICIDDSAIWALVAKGRRPRKWASMPLEPGLVKDGVVLDEDAVAAKVKELWRAQRLATGRVIAAISGINCLYRLLTLPELPRNLMPEAVKREAARLLAVPLEQLHLSWQALPSLKGETLVYLVASPRNAVDSLIATLRKSGLNPYLMDLKPLAIARSVTEPRAIIIDVQPASFDIVVMAERIPQVVRSVPLNPEDLLEERISFVREELDRAVTFYNSSHMDKPIEVSVPLFVCGELTEQEDAWELLAGREQRPVQVLPTPMETPEGFPPGQYTANVGLALKEVLASEKGAFAYSLVDFNALPEVYIPKPRPVSEFLLIPTIIVGIVLVALGAFVNINASPHNAALRAQLAKVSQMATSRLAQTTELPALREQVSLAEETGDIFSTTLHDLASTRDEVNGDLIEVNSCLPGVREDTLISVTRDVDALTVKGLFGDQDAVFRYAKDLRASGRFTHVVITDMDMDEDTQRMKFTLTLVKGTEGP